MGRHNSTLVVSQNKEMLSSKLFFSLNEKAIKMNLLYEKTFFRI